MTDRDPAYMFEMWGTTKLVTDYNSLNELREVTHDNKNKKVKTEEKELFSHESSWEYGIEPATLTE
jgi:hypothetical protein